MTKQILAEVDAGRFGNAFAFCVLLLLIVVSAAAGVLAQDAFAPARANLVDDFLAHIGEHLTTQPSDALALAETGTLTVCQPARCIRAGR